MTPELFKKVEIHPILKTSITFDFLSKEPYIKLITTPDLHKELVSLCRKTTSKIVMISPYVTEGALRQLLNEVNDDVDVTVITGTRPSLLEVMKAEKSLKRKISVDVWGRVHCKIILADNEVYIGSANLTESGIKQSIEAAIITNDPIIVNDVCSFCSIFTGGSRYSEPYYANIGSINTPTKSVFVSSVTNIPSLVLDLVKRATTNITILTPTYNYEAMRMLLNQVNPNVSLEVFVKLDENSWLRDISDPYAIRLLLEKGAAVWNIPRLHAKILLIDNKVALISSFNITNQAFSYIFDAGILTLNPMIIDSLVKFLEKIRASRRLKIERIKAEEFEEILANFNLKAPFEAARKQKEGDQFSDEEETSSLSAENVKVIKHDYPKHAGDGLSLTTPYIPQSLKAIRSKVKKAKPPDALEDGIILIGHKPLVNYFAACCFQFFKLDKRKVIVKARGKLIAKAVNLATIFKGTTISVTDIKVGTSMLIGPDDKIRPISFIEISLRNIQS